MHLKERYCVVGSFFSHQVQSPNIQFFPTALKEITFFENWVRSQAPDYVINAAGLTNREIAKEQPKLADAVNIVLPVTIATLATKVKAKFFHLSCAEIYDGIKGNYEETDNAYSLNHEFGKQKIAAESYIRAQTMESTVVRFGKVIGIGLPSRLNYFDKLRSQMAKGQAVEASKVKTYSYISIYSFLNAMDELLAHHVPGKHRLYHLGGVSLTEYDFVMGYHKLLGMDEKMVMPPAKESEKRNISLKSGLFESHFPGWKAETQNMLYANILRELSPGVGIKKWQKILQIP